MKQIILWSGHSSPVWGR